MPKAKPKEKRLHFAGYDFTSGPEGTVVHRQAPSLPGFQPGDRVEYRDVNLWQQGTVTGSDGKWIMVRWDGNAFVSREWAPNLRHVSTGSSARHHATKKSPAQLQREINEALAKQPKLSKHQIDLLSRRGRGGELRAGYLTPAGWHGDPMVIEDRKLRLEALREQPAPRFPKEPGRRSHATKRELPPTKRITTTAGDWDGYLAVHRDPMNDREFRLSWYTLDGTGSVGAFGSTESGFRSEAAARAYARKHYGGDPIRVPTWGVGPDMREKFRKRVIIPQKPW